MSSEGKSGAEEGKNQDVDAVTKTLFQRVSLRVSGTLKKKGRPPLAQRKFSIGQKVWVNDSGEKKLARVLSVGSKGITVDVVMQKGQTNAQIPITLLEPTAIGVDKWLQSVFRAFKEYDRSGCGMISRSDLESFFTSIGFPVSISFDRSRWWATEVPLASTGHAASDTTPPGFISLERFTESVMRCFPGLPPDDLRQVAFTRSCKCQTLSPNYRNSTRARQRWSYALTNHHKCLYVQTLIVRPAALSSYARLQNRPPLRVRCMASKLCGHAKPGPNP